MNIWDTVLNFPQVACSDHNIVVCCYQTESADDKFSCNNYDYKPCLQFSKRDHADHSRTYKQFICQRIHKLSEIGYKISGSGDLSVQHICKTCHAENNQCDPFVCSSAHACQHEKLQKIGTMITLKTVNYLVNSLYQLSYQIIFCCSGNFHFCEITSHQFFIGIYKKSVRLHSVHRGKFFRHMHSHRQLFLRS